MLRVKLVFGGGVFISDRAFATADQKAELFSVLTAHNVSAIDTSQNYGPSESRLGAARAGDLFALDTKAYGGFQPGSSRPPAIVSAAEQSIQNLGVQQVDIFYLHCPDRTVPLSETLSGINQIHNLGLFKRFGLSNFTAEEVLAVHAHCREKNYVLPTVYQGTYSALARLAETHLLPTLRQLNISFYAYSPIAGGFLARSSRSEIDHAPKVGRFDPTTPLGRVYCQLYARPAYLAALDEWGGIAREYGLRPAEMAYRWVATAGALDPAKGDAVVFGGRDVGQVRQTLEWIAKGELPADVVARIERLWEAVRHEAPLDNFNSGTL
ncbi:hypothetical protein ANO11243_021920 [Dothideomycetidae sp. 11243]|nr:hypothetical protein ANO11243_021920 [fungal sp. No.11243]